MGKVKATTKDPLDRVEVATVYGLQQPPHMLRVCFGVIVIVCDIRKKQVWRVGFKSGMDVPATPFP
jgi:hypothetical protein